MATTQDHAPPGACGYSDLAKGRVSVSMLSAGGIIGQRLQHVQQLRHVPHLLADGLRVQPATELVEVDVRHLARPCRRRTRSLPVSCPDWFITWWNRLCLSWGQPRAGATAFAMRAAAPQPCSDAWRRSPAARYPRALFRNSRAWGACPSTPSGFSETTMLSSKFIAGPDPSVTFGRHPRDQLAPFLDGLASGG